MNISKEDAKQSLTLIENTAAKTQKSLAAYYTCPFVLTWGLVWLLAFLGCHFYPKSSNKIWLALDAVGIICTLIIAYWLFKKLSPTKETKSGYTYRAIFWFWMLFMVYSIILSNLTGPMKGIRTSAFLCIMGLWCFVVFGLWMRINLLIWLGLIVTATTLIGYYVMPHQYYSLWMAFAGGAVLTVSAAYYLIRWK